MAAGKLISYLRVSTERQGASGLGIEAQRRAVADYLIGGRCALIAEYVEVESGANNQRPRLAKALARCRLHNATLVIAKLDRLSRDAHFLLGLEKAGVRFVCADMPEANELTIGLLAVVAQHERKMISVRTKAALAAAKARGKKLGGDRGNLSEVSEAGRLISLSSRRERVRERNCDLGPILEDIRTRGACSLRQIAVELNARGIPTARGGRWGAPQVKRVIDALPPVRNDEQAPAPP